MTDEEELKKMREHARKILETSTVFVLYSYAPGERAGLDFIASNQSLATYGLAEIGHKYMTKLLTPQFSSANDVFKKKEAEVSIS